MDDDAIAEGETATTVTVTATFDDGMARGADVEVTLSLGGTAAAADYTATGLTNITIPMGDTSAMSTVTLTPVDDNANDPGETIDIDGAATGFQVSSATVTITDNDGPAKPTFDDGASKTLSISEGHADGASVGTVGATDANAGDTLTYSHGGTDAATFTVNSSTGEISVASGVQLDFETKTSYMVEVYVTDSEDDNGNAEGSPQVDDTISVTINVTDVPDITLSVDTATLAETTPSSFTLVTVTATLQDGAATVSIPLSLGGTAMVDTDYNRTPLTPPTISISNASSGTATINIRPIDDDDGVSEVIEVDATVAGYEVTPASITLVDDDLPAIMLSVNPDSVGEAAGSTQVTVTATRDMSAATEQVTVTLALDATSTAVSGADYDASLSLPTISLAANQTSNTATFMIDPLDDADTTSETLVIGGSATGFTVSAATLTINDDDVPSTSWTLTVSPTSLREAAGSTDVTLTAKLDGGALGSNVTVTFGALGGSGTATAADYAVTDEGGTAITTPAAVTITAGQTEATRTIKITPVDDDLDESNGTPSRPDETIEFSGTATGGLTSTETATLTITDDDTASTNIRLSVDTDSAAGDQDDIGEGDGETTVTVTATVTGRATHLVDRTVAVQVVSAPGGATPSAQRHLGRLPR